MSSLEEVLLGSGWSGFPALVELLPHLTIYCPHLLSLGITLPGKPCLFPLHLYYYLTSLPPPPIHFPPHLQCLQLNLLHASRTDVAALVDALVVPGGPSSSLRALTVQAYAGVNFLQLMDDHLTHNHFPSLQELVVTDNEEESWPGGAPSLPLPLPSSPGYLRRLTLRSLEFERPAMVYYFKDVLSSHFCHRLEYLSLSATDLYHFGAAKSPLTWLLETEPKALPLLQELVLCKTRVLEKEMDMIAAGCLPSLRVLHLDYLPPPPPQGDTTLADVYHHLGARRSSIMVVVKRSEEGGGGGGGGGIWCSSGAKKRWRAFWARFWGGRDQERVMMMVGMGLFIYTKVLMVFMVIAMVCGKTTGLMLV